MKILDISPTISKKLAVWPGDTPFDHRILMSTDQGDHLGLSQVTTTLHLGAHADAPNHYAKEAQGISQRSLHYYLGPVQVEKANVRPGERVGLKHLRADFALQAPRLLVKTQSFPDPENWNQDFCALDPQFLETLAKQACLLIGIDTPSVDLFECKELLSHQVLHKYNMAVLEGLVLDAVEPGLYSLVAPPLPIQGGDASPVRALLLPHEIFKEVDFSPALVK